MIVGSEETPSDSFLLALPSNFLHLEAQYQEYQRRLEPFQYQVSHLPTTPEYSTLVVH